MQAARHVVGGNKRRFNQDGFDLDLVYVNELLIGMSTPSVGGMAFYRNPVDEVARFFNTRCVEAAPSQLHAAHPSEAALALSSLRRHPDGFVIYNCTSECSYPTDLFNGNVRRVAIDDHNVPTLDALLSFCRELEMTRQSRPETVFALHCKGGKGR